MWDSIPRKVLVGVETADCLPSLRAAAEEAAWRGCGVHLLHVLPPVYASHPHIEELSEIAGELQHAGTAVVNEAARKLEDMLPDDLVVSTELRHGAVVPSLVEAGAHACLLVLHNRHEHHDRHFHLLSTIQSVAARSPCPVLVVPATWHDQPPSDVPSVVAGVEDASRSARVIRTALAEASRRHATLRLVHGINGHGERAHDMDVAAFDAWLRRSQRDLEAELSDLCGSRPDVTVEVDVLPATPAAALETRSRGAALLVMGRGSARLHFVTRPGPVTAEALRRATCPVMVVDEGLPGPAPRRRELSQVAVP